MQNKCVLISFFLFIGAISHAKTVGETKYLCIPNASGGLLYKSGTWQGTSFQTDSKYLMTVKNGALTSVKEFGAAEDLAMKYCRLLEPTKSYACTSNFSMFRFQPSSKRFVMAKTSGYTNEFEEEGINLLSTSFTPNISVGLCEAL